MYCCLRERRDIVSSDSSAFDRHGDGDGDGSPCPLPRHPHDGDGIRVRGLLLFVSFLTIATTTTATTGARRLLVIIIVSIAGRVSSSIGAYVMPSRTRVLLICSTSAAARRSCAFKRRERRELRESPLRHRFGVCRSSLRSSRPRPSFEASVRSASAVSWLRRRRRRVGRSSSRSSRLS